MSSKVSWVTTGSTTDPCCCESECCMYPAVGLGDTYTSNDLPDALNVLISGQLYEFDKIGSEYYGGEGADGYAQWRIVKNVDEWNFERETGSLGDGDWENAGEFTCLIAGDGNLTPGNDGVEDQFESSYEVNAYNFVDAEWVSFTLTRVSLCEWTSGNVSLFYTNLLDVPTWTFDDGDVAHQKQGFQNTPVGNYQDGGELQQITISIP